MYGLIVVEPKEGLEKADREFYVMQGEIYAAGKRGEKGHLEYDGEQLFREQPQFVVFNGKAAGLTGEIFDVVHPEGASEKLRNIQTTLIPAGGATWVEFTLDAAGQYILVDHAVTRAIDKGAVAFLEVEGPDQNDIFHAESKSTAGH